RSSSSSPPRIRPNRSPPPKAMPRLGQTLERIRCLTGWSTSSRLRRSCRFSWILSSSASSVSEMRPRVSSIARRASATLVGWTSPRPRPSPRTAAASPRCLTRISRAILAPPDRGPSLPVLHGSFRADAGPGAATAAVRPEDAEGRPASRRPTALPRRFRPRRRSGERAPLPRRLAVRRQRRDLYHLHLVRSEDADVAVTIEGDAVAVGAILARVDDRPQAADRRRIQRKHSAPNAHARPLGDERASHRHLGLPESVAFCLGPTMTELPAPRNPLHARRRGPIFPALETRWTLRPRESR